MTDEAAERSPKDDGVTCRERIWLAAEQLRLTAIALHAMAGSLDDASEGLTDQIERLEHRSAELMRAASRLGTSLDVSSAWGLDLLFRSTADMPMAKTTASNARRPADSARPAPPAMSTAVRPVSSPNESIELAPIALLTPEVAAPPRRRPQSSRIPQSPLPPIPRPLDEPPRLEFARG